MYIDGKRLQELVILYNAGDRSCGDEIALMLGVMAKVIMNTWQFNVDREAVIQDCVIIVWSKLGKFDENRSSFFNWATTIMLNEMRQRYKEEYNFVELKLKLLDRMVAEKGISKDDIQGWKEATKDKIRKKKKKDE